MNEFIFAVTAEAYPVTDGNPVTDDNMSGESFAFEFFRSFIGGRDDEFCAIDPNRQISNQGAFFQRTFFFQRNGPADRPGISDRVCDRNLSGCEVAGHNA